MASREFNSLQVSLACKNYLARREFRIEKDREDLILALMTDRRFFGWLGPVASTREEAIAYAQKKSNGGFNTLWGEPEEWGTIEADHVQGILDMAEAKWAASSQITLNTSDIDLIGGELNGLSSNRITN